MRTGTKFWLAVAVGVGFPVVVFLALLLSGFRFDALTLGVIMGTPVTVFTAFGIFNVTASGQAANGGQKP